MKDTTTQKLDKAAEIVDSKFGPGTAISKPELVAAILQSLALEQHALNLQVAMEQMTEQLCRAAAVAAGD